MVIGIIVGVGKQILSCTANVFAVFLENLGSTLHRFEKFYFQVRNIVIIQIRNVEE